MTSDTGEYLRQNKTILFLFVLWAFRLLFLQQGNEGGVAINKFVLVQIFAELGIFAALMAHGFNFFLVFTAQPMAWFCLLYLMGVFSILWGVFPLMGGYFAFQNIVMVSALYYLASRTKDFLQLERFYIFANLFILWAFFIRTILLGGGYFHSVAYSTVAGYLLVYSVAEYDPGSRPPENLKMLRKGIFWGALGLAVTTSGGAMVSVAAAFCVLAMFAKQPLLKLGAFLGLCALLIGYFSGATDWVYELLFPGKTMAAISTGHGRKFIWDMILERAQERPWLGWGYASVERILPIYCIDAHKSVVGVIGSLGYIGCTLLILGMLSLFFFVLGRTSLVGMRGLLAAAVCGLVNSNTSNFIASKAGLQALAFQMVVVMAAVCVMFAQKKTGSSLQERLHS